MAKKPDLSEFEALTDLEELRRINVRLENQLRKAKDRTEQMREAIREGMHDALVALGPLAPVKTPRKDPRRKRGEIALWHLTDWQGSKVTTSYNSEVMRERVMRFCDKAEQLTQIQRADHPVDEAVVMLGGDMGEGLFNYPAQPFEIDATLFGQFASIARVEAEVVRRALALYRKVRVISEWGNHGRLGSKRAAVPRSDNLDRMIHELAKEKLSGEARLLSWADTEEDIQHIEIGNYRALLVHGDEFSRTGYASVNTIMHKVAAWKSGAYPWDFRDVYMGHYHQHAEHPLPDGEGAIYRTGAPESDNRYARDQMASSAAPTQRLHFIDPRHGRVTAQYRVDLS
jgi:hypothetical protein